MRCVARGVRSKICFSAGVDKTISRVFLFEALFCTGYYPPFFEMLVFFFHHMYLLENGTACHQSGFPVQEQVWGTLSSKFGRAGCRAPCVTRVCAACDDITSYFISQKKKKKHGPSVQIAWVQVLSFEV